MHAFLLREMNNLSGECLEFFRRRICESSLDLCFFLGGEMYGDVCGVMCDCELENAVSVIKLFFLKTRENVFYNRPFSGPS